jgi:hypothetical protein
MTGQKTTDWCTKVNHHQGESKAGGNKTILHISINNGLPHEGELRLMLCCINHSYLSLHSSLYCWTWFLNTKYIVLKHGYTISSGTTSAGSSTVDTACLPPAQVANLHLPMGLHSPLADDQCFPLFRLLHFPTFEKP